MSLLVVDDDAGDLAHVRRLAKAAFPNVRVRTTTDGPCSVTLCAQEEFDCVILDYSMPGTDGLECAKQIRAAHPYLPIIMSTGCGDEMLAARAITTGVTDYIPKARMTQNSLLRVVESAVKVCGQARIIDQQHCELEHFTYALAHDFKQPIRQIKTFSVLASAAIQSGDSQTVLLHMEFLKNAADRLGKLVDVMSQYTLLGQQPEISDIDLRPVLAGVLESMQPYLQERRGRVTFGDLPIVRGNAVLLGQVLQNLIVNGLKYNQSETPVVDISTEDYPGQCIIRVRDNGIGIEPRYVGEIFKSLVRLHTEAQYSGTGLGLAMAQKAITAMRGAITCESWPGRGSAFAVTIPHAAGLSQVESRISHFVGVPGAAAGHSGPGNTAEMTGISPGMNIG